MNRIKAVPVTLLAVAISVGAAACRDDSPNASTDTSTETTEATETTATPPTSESSDTTESSATTGPGDATEPTDPSDVSAPGEEPTVESATPVLVGLTEAEATAAAEEQGWILRVMRRDDEDLVGTLDLRPNRVNVEVTDGEVTAILNVG